MNHLTALNEKLLETAVGVYPRLMVVMPPRHGKSMLVSQYFTAWHLGKFPDEPIILCSYEADFAASWGRKARAILEEYGPTVFGVKVSPISHAANRWELEGRRGEMITAGVGGPITGRGAKLLVLDDPVKNWEEAHSLVYRERTWDWWRSTAYTRLEPGGKAVIILTRWHQDDLAGRLLAEMAAGGEEWEVLRLPALAEENDPLGREPGEALWPWRYPVKVLNNIQQAVGEYVWSSMYGGSPLPPGGLLFKREWFKVVEAVPDNLDRQVRAWDLAATVSPRAAYTAGALIAKRGGSYYILDIRRARATPLGVEQLVVQTAAVDGPNTRIWMEQEPGATGVISISSFVELLAGYSFRGVPPSGSKEERARPLATQAEAGNVYLLAGPWNKALLDELESFPLGTYKDQVDALALAFSQITMGGFIIA